MSIRENILEQYPDEEFLFADGFDDAIIGVSSNFIIVYSVNTCIEILKNEMSEEDAIEYFNFNIECAYVGEKTPIYVYNIN